MQAKVNECGRRAVETECASAHSAKGTLNSIENDVLVSSTERREKRRE
jgi:hypothetical protein